MTTLFFTAETEVKLILIKRILRLGLICFLGLTPCRSVQAQRQDPEPSESQDDIADLKKDVTTLLAQQKQLIEQMGELKRLVSANSGYTTPQPPQPPSTIGVRGESFRGDSAARVAIIEYSDFECPFCGQYEHSTYPQLFENYIKTGKVKLFFRDLPLPMHAHAMAAARAARCAGEQDKYWEMHDSLFAKQTALSDQAVLDRAKTLGLDANKFSECFSGDKYSDDLRKSMAEAQTMGVDGTPTFLIGTIDPSGENVNISKRIAGTHPYEAFRSALDEVLAPKSMEAVSTH